MIDLHTHTNCSDGTFSPEQLVALAKENNLSALAITDHDTVDAIQPGMDAAKARNIQLISGVELSIAAELPNNGHMHLLGLFIDSNNKQLIEKLDFLRTKRTDRVYAILEKLNDLDFPVSTDDLHLDDDNQVSIGRPHIARIMVNYGYVASIREAFDRFLCKEKPAFVEKERISLETAIGLIHDAGGLSVLAHPISLAFEKMDQFGEYISGLARKDLDGIEAYSSFHPPEFTDYLIRFARSNNLCISGGSDFHGANKSEIELGRGIGNLNVPDSVLSDLEAKRGPAG